MKLFLSLIGTLFIISFVEANDSKICQKCHPLIYGEYYQSSHRKASTVNDPIYKALWDQHPKDAKGYSCAKCHSPSDLKALKTGVLQYNEVQKEEPISCTYCHSIKDVKEGKLSNTNILRAKKREFYTAQADKKGSPQASYETKSSWFGLVKESQNSPYHKIDYNNENFYNGNVCMGCHSHTNNEHSFDITMLDALIDKNDKNTCITCHMPQVSGTKVTIHETKTHAYHGIAGIYHRTKDMGKYIEFKVQKRAQGFELKILNKTNHALFGQSFRQGILEVKIIRGSKVIELEPYIFTRVLGKDGKEAMPWNANMSIKDTLIYAKKDIMFTQKLQAGDKLNLTLGVRRISVQKAKELGLTKSKNITKIKVLKTQTFSF